MMKKKKVLEKDKELKKQLEEGRPVGEKDFYTLLKKVAQQLRTRNMKKK